MTINPTKSPNEYGVDGIDHINVSPDAHTHLGRLLDPCYIKVFEYPYIGKFCSVRALWGWLRHYPLDDKFRRASKKDLMRLFTYNHENCVYVPNFLAIVAQATYIKLCMDPKALSDFKRLYKEKDFVSYSIPPRCVVRVKNGHSDILMACLQAIAEELDKPTPPDFSRLCKHPKGVGYFYLESFLRKTMSDEILDRLGIRK